MENENIKALLDSNSKNFQIVDLPLSLNHLKEFYEMSTTLESEEDEEEILETTKDWQVMENEVLQPKIVRLAQFGTVKAYRRLEEIVNNATGDLRLFTIIGFNQARLILENSLLDQPVGLIASGLGGKDNKIRYYFAVVTKEEELTEAQVRLVKQTYGSVAEEMESEIEEIVPHTNFILFRILGSLKHSIGTIIEKGIEECPFLDEHYFVTNVSRPTEEDILKWMES